MKTLLHLNGTLNITFTQFNSVTEVSDSAHARIVDNLQKGEYVISLNDRTVTDLSNFLTPLYSFTFDVESNTEYEWELEEE